jgi:hypothetical protein
MGLRVRWAGLVCLVALSFAVAGCATQPSPTGTGLPGFWYGLLHGFIMLFTLIGSLFWHVRVYAYPNAGRWYDFGFVVGAMMFWGGSHAGKMKKTGNRE